MNKPLKDYTQEDWERVDRLLNKVGVEMDNFEDFIKNPIEHMKRKRAGK